MCVSWLISEIAKSDSKHDHDLPEDHWLEMKEKSNSRNTEIKWSTLCLVIYTCFALSKGQLHVKFKGTVSLKRRIYMYQYFNTYVNNCLLVFILTPVHRTCTVNNHGTFKYMYNIKIQVPFQIQQSSNCCNWIMS